MERALALRDHLVGNRLLVSMSPSALYERIKARLLRAYDDEQLMSTRPELLGMLRMDAKRTEIICGPSKRNFKHDPTLPQLRRADGATLDFALMLAQRSRHEIEIAAYDYELRFRAKEPSFIRFDLNPAGHANDGDGQRAHVHVGTNDDGMAAPSPALTPDDALDLLLYGLRRTGRERHHRARTDSP